jgi:HSP20 family protein
MAIKDLIPWNDKGRDVGFQRATEVHPFLALHREMNRMFDDVFRGFDLAPFGLGSRTLDGLGWPQIRFERRIPLEDVEEEKVSAAFKNGVLTITVPKSAETKNVRRIAINRNG